MMEEMSSLDINYALKELRGLQGGKIQKIYQRDRNFRVRIYAQGSNHELMISPGRIHLSQFDRKGPKKPSNFCMFLRKHLRNETLREIKQHKFDRIVELKTGSKTLVCEIFGKGNFVLLDGDGKIVQPLEVQRWSEREIKSGVEYKYPPAGKDPRKVGKREFKRILDKDK
ncbi:MAG: NFACT family protein, partial [Candidatus Aenigmatarchaeota archaeon]